MMSRKTMTDPYCFCVHINLEIYLKNKIYWVCLNEFRSQANNCYASWYRDFIPFVEQNYFLLKGVFEFTKILKALYINTSNRVRVYNQIPSSFHLSSVVKQNYRIPSFVFDFTINDASGNNSDVSR